jgi:pimeloyl-ACP methyl ester carboxylesterase
MAAEARPFSVGPDPSLQGESAGEGQPVVLCHGITATRRYVLHGSKALPRAGYDVVTYDARGHGESDPAPAGESYGYPELVGDLERVVEAQVGDGAFFLGGHSMGAHTAIAYTLRHPGRVMGLALVGPVYTGAIEPASLDYWDGLAAALETEGVDGFVAYIDGRQGVDGRWRDSVLRFTRERLLLQRHPEALAVAMREVTRSQPFGSLDELGELEVPTLVVASNDDADPGHPYEVAAAYAQSLPNARLLSEDPGESPLAWQGGKLSRALAAFYAEALSSAR